MSLEIIDKNQIVGPEESAMENVSNSVEDLTVNQYFTRTAQSSDLEEEILGSDSIKARPSTAMEDPKNNEDAIEIDRYLISLNPSFSEELNEPTPATSENYTFNLDGNVPRLRERDAEPIVTQLYPTEPAFTTPIKQERPKIASEVLRTPESAHNCASAYVAEGASPALIERMRKISDDILATKTKPTKPPTKSPFFSPPVSAKKPKISPSKEKKPRIRAGTVSCIPFPPLHFADFGLLQEKLSQDPFRLLIGVTFLNRTKGRDAIPIFFKLMENYPTPGDILAAKREDIVAIQYHLGFQTQRAETYQKYAHFWINDPPVKGKRYRVDHYPGPGDGMDIKKGEVLNDSDPRSAWEIGHVTQGRYAIDSWRIFCRDILRGEAEGWNGDGREDGFQPEWMRVQPRDKELIAFLRWMWLKEGFEWDPVTGEKEVAGKELMEAAIEGKIAWDDLGGLRIADNEEDILIMDGDIGNMETLSHRKEECEHTEPEKLS